MVSDKGISVRRCAFIHEMVLRFLRNGVGLLLHAIEDHATGNQRPMTFHGVAKGRASRFVTFTRRVRTTCTSYLVSLVNGTLRRDDFHGKVATFKQSAPHPYLRKRGRPFATARKVELYQ